MEPDRWQQVERVYHAAMESGKETCAELLDRECLGDPALRAEVESLLKYAERPAAFLESPAVEVMARELAEDLRAQSVVKNFKMVDARIGQYRIVGKLGAGGMGDVYRAVRADDQYEKQVAIKLVREGLDSESVYNRFRQERQILASFEHENIARLIDGGSTEEGHPYFVMELVEGEPIDEYCDRCKLGLAARLDLFQKVCSAVQYAHQRLVVHRDIKPGNILVTADGVPKLLDFGIATILNTDADFRKSALTVTAMRVMTPQFASPEQLRGAIMTTATDIYSLGVVLYRLLTGCFPYRISSSSPYDLSHAICEVEPEKPSTALEHLKRVSVNSSEGDHVSTDWIGHCRGTSAEKLHKMLCGDLDQILLKALRKEPQRRYASVHAFAEDLRLYTLGLPVSARRDTFSYRSGKFIRRHKLSLAATAAVGMLIIAGALAIVREAQIARMQEARAERRFDDLRKLTDSLIFEFHDSIEHLPGSTTARELVVRRALEYLDEISAEGNNDPATLRDLAAADQRIGRVLAEELAPHLGGTGSLNQARQLFEKSFAIRQKLAKANPTDQSAQVDQLESMQYLAAVNHQLGDIDRALAIQQQRLQMAERLSTIHDSEDMKSEVPIALNGIAVEEFFLGDYDAAVAYERRSLAKSQVLLRADPNDYWGRRRVAVSLFWIGTPLYYAGRFKEAAVEERRSLAAWEKLAADYPNNTSPQRNVAEENNELCRSLAYSGAVSEFSAHCMKAIAILGGMVKSDPKNVQAISDFASVIGSMGVALYAVHRPDAALRWHERALALYKDVATRDPESINNTSDYAVNLIYLGRIEAHRHHPAVARKHVQAATEMLQALARRSPKDHLVSVALQEANAVAQALPNDSVPIVPH